MLEWPCRRNTRRLDLAGMRPSQNVDPAGLGQRHQAHPGEGIEPIAHGKEAVPPVEAHGIPRDVFKMLQRGIEGVVALMIGPACCYEEDGHAKRGSPKREIGVFPPVAGKHLIEATNAIEGRRPDAEGQGPKQAGMRSFLDPFLWKDAGRMRGSKFQKRRVRPSVPDRAVRQVINFAAKQTVMCACGAGKRADETGRRDTIDIEKDEDVTGGFAPAGVPGCSQRQAGSGQWDAPHQAIILTDRTAHLYHDAFVWMVTTAKPFDQPREMSVTAAVYRDDAHAFREIRR